jgi:transcription elongation factor Elf1
VIDAGERIQFLKRALGDCEIARDGVNIAFWCPNCNSERAKRKLVVKIDTGQWHCWVCETKGGSVSSLLRKFSKQYYNDWLQNYERKEIRDRFLDDDVPKQEPIIIPDGYTIDQLSESIDPDAQAIVSYLYERGINEDLAYRKRILGVTNGRLRRRIVIPSFDFEGNLNYWTARSIDKDTKMRYVNPKVDRKTIIFNDVDIDWKKEITLVEGPFDMIKAGDNAVALLGSTLAQDSELFKKIINNQTPVLLALDNDALVKSHKIARALYQYNISVKFLELRNDRDVGDMSCEEFQEYKKQAYSWSPYNRLMFKINNIASGSMF